MKTELSKFFSYSLMTFNTDIAVTLNKEPFFFRIVGLMTGKTVTLDCRGMAERTLAVLARFMTLSTQGSRLGHQSLLDCFTMAGMAIKAGPFFIRLMLTAHLATMLIGMTLQAETIGALGEKVLVVTGMGIVAGAALAFHNRLMDTGRLVIYRFMTGGTQGVRLRWWQQGARLTASMAGRTFALGHGAMDFSLQEARAC